MNRARVAEAARGASLHIQAEYQSQIFDRYHLLLLDKSYMGYGEGMLEERVSDYMDYTLSGYGFAVEDACLTDVRTVVADDCYDFKKTDRGIYDAVFGNKGTGNDKRRSGI